MARNSFPDKAAKTDWAVLLSRYKGMTAKIGCAMAQKLCPSATAETELALGQSYLPDEEAKREQEAPLSPLLDMTARSGLGMKWKVYQSGAARTDSVVAQTTFTGKIAKTLPGMAWNGVIVEVVLGQTCYLGTVVGQAWSLGATAKREGEIFRTLIRLPLQIMDCQTMAWMLRMEGTVRIRGFLRWNLQTRARTRTASA